MGEVDLNLRLSHLAGMAFSVKEDEAAHPLDVAAFCGLGIMLAAQYKTHLIEQAGRFVGHENPPVGCPPA